MYLNTLSAYVILYFIFHFYLKKLYHQQILVGIGTISYKHKR